MQSSQLSEISIGGNFYPLKIKNIKSSKSIKLRVLPDYILATKASYISKSEVLSFIKANEAWLLSKLNEEKESLESYLADVPFLSLNKLDYKVVLLKDPAQTCIINHARRELLFSYIDSVGLAEILLGLAKKILPEMLRDKARSLGMEISKISVRSQRSLWGSRSSSGMLSLNWRIILLPENLQNYIICHELAHIKFMDHSTSFWIYLNSFCPNAKKLDRLLAEESRRIFKLI